MLKKIKHDWLILAIAFTLVCAIFYGYYLVTKHSKLDIVYKNWDGPSYVITAISLYNPEIAASNNFINSADIRPDWTFLPAHFPLFPLAIRLFSFIGYFQSMLLVSVLFSFLSLIALYELVSSLKLTKHPLLVTLPFIFLTPRYFAVSHVGNSESMFMFFTIMMLLYFGQKNHLSSAIFASLAVATRPWGVFYGVGFALLALWELFKSRDLSKVVREYSPYLLMPLTVLLVFIFYYFQTGNFFAFFEAIALTKNLQPIPFNSFTFPSRNIETFWQEINALDYVLFLSGIFLLFRKKLSSFAIIALTYFIPLVFLQHSDISRYAIPLIPFVFLGFSEILEKKEITLATFLMSPAIILYAINFLDHNHGA